MADEVETKERLARLEQRLVEGELGEQVLLALEVRELRDRVASSGQTRLLKPTILVPAIATVAIGVLTLSVQTLSGHLDRQLGTQQMKHQNTNKLVELYAEATQEGKKVAMLSLMTTAPWLDADVKSWAKREQESLATDIGKETKERVVLELTTQLNANKADAIAPTSGDEPAGPGPEPGLSPEQVKSVEAKAEEKGQEAEKNVKLGRSLEGVKASSPETVARALWYEGYRAFGAGKIESAELLYAQSREADPTYAPPVNSLGRIALKEERYEAAELLFREAKTLDANYSPSAFNLIIALAEQHKIAEARVLFKYASKQWPKYKNRERVAGLLRTKSAEAKSKNKGK